MSIEAGTPSLSQSRRAASGAAYAVLCLAGGILAGLGSACGSGGGGDSCSPGLEGCACVEGECIGDLICTARVCRTPPNAGSGGDGGAGGPGSGGDDGGADGGGTAGPIPEPTAGNGNGETGGGGQPENCGALPVSLEGGAVTSIAPLEFDDFEVSVGHKRDIDPIEDGCINSVTLTLRKGSGCELTVYAADLIAGDELAVQEVELAADSQCPGFTDSQEGLYLGGAAGSTVRLSHLTIAEENVASSCFRGSLTLDLMETLDGPAALEVSAAITLTGDFITHAVEAACPMAANGDDDDDTGGADTAGEDTGEDLGFDRECVAFGEAFAECSGAREDAVALADQCQFSVSAAEETNGPACSDAWASWYACLATRPCWELFDLEGCPGQLEIIGDLC